MQFPGTHNLNPLAWPCFATPDFTRVLTSFNNCCYDCLGYLGLWVNYVSCHYTDKHYERRDIYSILYCNFVGKKIVFHTLRNIFTVPPTLHCHWNEIIRWPQLLSGRKTFNSVENFANFLNHWIIGGRAGDLWSPPLDAGHASSRPEAVLDPLLPGSRNLLNLSHFRNSFLTI